MTSRHKPERREFILNGASAATIFFLPHKLQPMSFGEIGLVDRQPFAAQARRVVAALDQLGAPIKPADLIAFDDGLALPNDAEAVARATRILDGYALTNVTINPEGKVSVTRGAAQAELVEQGWRVFLIKVSNQGAVSAPLTVTSSQALAVSDRTAGSGFGPIEIAPPAASRPAVNTITERDVAERWLDLGLFNDPPMTQTLSGLEVEYRILQLYSRERGQREATLLFTTDPGSADLGGRNALPILFRCVPATTLVLRVRDIDGSPMMASFTVRDAAGRIYPARSKRLAPDFRFQKQVYRADGETLLLPAGDYMAEVGRGPEYFIIRQMLEVKGNGPQSEAFQLVRWIDPAAYGWYSGDHHIHAAGCAHYNTPTEGVEPSVIARHVRGEGLRIGEVLDWAPSWYYQKRFFTGHVDHRSTHDALLRYDVEVSGFPSSHCGHLLLLGLRDMEYPNTTQIEQWPTWNLPILQWAKEQGAVVGYPHTGVNLNVNTTDLPNTEIPPFNGAGANEYLIDIAHEVNGEQAVDLFSTVDSCAPQELNLWYHSLNMGFRTRIGGETDFPCYTDLAVGVGRSYVYLNKPPEGDAGYREWLVGLKAGRAYVSDGHSHLMDFQVNDIKVGMRGSELHLEGPGTVHLTVRVAAWLEPSPTAETEMIRRRPLTSNPYWHTERARIRNTRTVLIECVVNGIPGAQQTFTADGIIREVTFDVPIKQSSWIALRIYPAAHTNPVFVTIAGKPVRASRESAEWCLRCVDRSWEQQSPRISAADRKEAAAAYEHARLVYRQRIREIVA